MHHLASGQGFMSCWEKGSALHPFQSRQTPVSLPPPSHRHLPKKGEAGCCGHAGPGVACWDRQHCMATGTRWWPWERGQREKSTPISSSLLPKRAVRHPHLHCCHQGRINSALWQPGRKGVSPNRQERTIPYPRPAVSAQPRDLPPKQKVGAPISPTLRPCLAQPHFITGPCIPLCLVQSNAN